MPVRLQARRFAQHPPRLNNATFIHGSPTSQQVARFFRGLAGVFFLELIDFHLARRRALHHGGGVALDHDRRRFQFLRPRAGLRLVESLAGGVLETVPPADPPCSPPSPSHPWGSPSLPVPTHPR